MQGRVRGEIVDRDEDLVFAGLSSDGKNGVLEKESRFALITFLALSFHSSLYIHGCSVKKKNSRSVLEERRFEHGA